MQARFGIVVKEIAAKDSALRRVIGRSIPAILVVTYLFLTDPRVTSLKIRAASGTEINSRSLTGHGGRDGGQAPPSGAIQDIRRRDVPQIPDHLSAVGRMLDWEIPNVGTKASRLSERWQPDDSS